MNHVAAKPRIPPGQQLAAAQKWPLVGERSPAASSAASGGEWRVEVTGCVRAARSFSLGELAAMGRVEQKIDIHCVTRWSKLDMPFEGVPLAALLANVRPTAEARFISFTAQSDRGHSTSLVLDEATTLDCLLATHSAGRPLPAQHGGPLRLVVPRRYFYKSLKWLVRIELLSEDRLGFWEATAQYHNHADPWNEERYATSAISPEAAQEIAARRSIAGENLTGIDLAGGSLAGLIADEAILRDARFNGCNLAGSSFARANLSNAQFHSADLRGANFRGADLEGAEFTAADLRGADLRAVSLLGCTFFEPQTGEAARIDRTTQIPTERIDDLAPAQQERLLAAIREAGETGA